MAQPDNETPHPGSREALDAGCRCPVLDNNHGRFPPCPPDENGEGAQWWITWGCPVHAPVPCTLQSGTGTASDLESEADRG